LNTTRPEFAGRREIAKKQGIGRRWSRHCRAKYFAGVRVISRLPRAPALRVLVVDDEFLIRWSIAETLSAAGHEVAEAQDAASAVSALTTTPDPDVVLLDFRLPDSDDLSLLATIRRLAPASAVVLMTAFGTPDVTAGALELGARTVLSKPFNMKDLVGILSAWHPRHS
jgi:DNA-binding NtrC family response regulator